MQSLAVKYRPQDWSDVVEQSSTITILQNQLESNGIKNSYLFVGSAGTGKTTCARIMANKVNSGQGSPIELDAASNNGVDDVRDIIQQAQTKSIDSEYKVFIIDECHALSNNAWQAFLKLIEEPPAKSIFIFCTTDPQKIPKTIISRVQRFDFQRISTQGIYDRLCYVLRKETANSDLGIVHTPEALYYIAKMSSGGMRDSLTLLDKCLAYSRDVTIDNVLKALGTVDYNTMCDLIDFILKDYTLEAVKIIDEVFMAGKDLKQFTDQLIKFMIEVNKYILGCEYELLSLPNIKDIRGYLDDWIEVLNDEDAPKINCVDILNKLVELKASIKYSSTVKADWEAMLLCM